MSVGIMQHAIGSMAGPGARLLRRRRRAGTRGGPAPRANAGLGGGRAERLARTCASSTTPSTRRAAASGTSARSTAHGSAASARTTAYGRAMLALGRDDRDGPRSRAGRRRGCARRSGTAGGPRAHLTRARRRRSCWGAPRSVDCRPGRTRRRAMLTRPRDPICTTGSGATRRPTGRGRKRRLTYENALLPRALIVAGRSLESEPMVDRRPAASLDWLIDAQTAPDGHLSPVGNGWWPRGGEMSHFDQQPIEATALLLAAEAAYAATGDARYAAAMERCYAWFLGANDLGLYVADPARGACCDGLTPTGGQRERGSRVDADVAHGRRAHPGVPRSSSARIPTVARSCWRRRPGDASRSRSSGAIAANPILTAADVPYPANSVFNPGCRSSRGRDDPPRPRRGPPGDLPAPRGAER